MEIIVRKWLIDDLSNIQRSWLDYCRNAARSDMQWKSDANSAMKTWLAKRFYESQVLGYVAEANDEFAGFLIGRIGDWESAPPVIEPRRIGIIDAVYVVERLRHQGIGGQLIENAIMEMRTASAVAVETIYDAWDGASADAWHHAGFAPWMVHAYRML